MTNLEALKSVIGSNYPFDPNMYDKALTDAGIDGTATYVATNVKAIDLCVAGLLLTVIISPDIAEGGYKLTQADRNALIALRNSILNKYGIPTGTSIVTDKSYLW